MSKFIKLPVEIEAVRIIDRIEIKTLEGILYGKPGDWLITGIEGEKYPCDNEIFRKTYYPSGKDKCLYCKQKLNIPCYECVFEWNNDI